MKKTLLIFAILIGAAYAAPMGVWCCRKCQLTVKSGSQPKVGVCPERGGHNWVHMGDAGDESWQCKKCAKLLRTNGRPLVGTCPKGNGHIWQKL